MKVRGKRSLFAGGVAVTAVAVAAAYVLATAGPATAKPFATLDVLQGSVEVQAGSGASHQGAEGEPLHQGDTVITGDGRAEIEYSDGSVTRLDHGTTFALQELATTADAEQITGAQASGSTFSRVVELTGSDSRFDVETPSAVASVRGTVFFVEVDSGLIGVIKGEVQVSGETGAARVIAGRGVTVTEQGEVSLPFVLTPEILDSDFLFYNLCVLDHVLASCHRVLADVVERDEPEPKPGQPVVVSTVEPDAAPEPEARDPEGGQPAPPPPATQPPQQEEVPPAPQAQPPEPPPPPENPAGPPCDNPGVGTPCDGPGNAGAPPGQGGVGPPGQTKNG